MPELPTLLFIPGSWHKPVCYDKVISRLHEKHGLRCTSVTLPSTSGDPAATFRDDVNTARDAISDQVTQGRDVVVIAHSYGGMVGNSAIKGFTRPREHTATAPSSTEVGHVIGIILITSGFTLTGLSFMDPLLGHPPPAWRVNSDTGYAEIVTDPRELFYHDLPPEQAEHWAGQLTTQSLKSLFEGGEFAYAGWQDVPVWYLGAVEDRGLPVVVQRMQVGMAREMGGSVVHRELQTSHSPFLSQPDLTAGFILEAVEAFAGRAVDATAGDGVRRDLGFTAPAPRLWQPLSWIRFGMPLLLGRVVGRTYLTYRWARRLFGYRQGEYADGMATSISPLNFRTPFIDR